MSLWNMPGVPQKGWKLISVDDQGKWTYTTCDMCGNSHVRHLHIVVHGDSGQELGVGRDCAARMCEVYKRRDRKSPRQVRSALRSRWLRRKWTVLGTTSECILTDLHSIVVFLDPTVPGAYRYLVDGQRSRESL